MSEQTQIFPMMNDQCEVSQTQAIYNAYDLYLDEDIKEPSYYRHALQVLRSGQRGDLIRLYISSYGGNLNSAIMFRNAILDCEADVIAIIEAEAYSAASLIALSAPSIEVKPYATMMLHSASFGSSGSTQNVRDHVDFTGRHAESLMEEVYSEFISAEELLDLKRGRELWFDYKEIGVRLDRMFEAREAKMEVCNDPECTSCSTDEDEEPVDFLDMVESRISDGVEKGLEKILKKYDLVLKPEKPKKTPAKKIVNKVFVNPVDTTLELD